jgi:plasmid segregation protein ParM
MTAVFVACDDGYSCIKLAIHDASASNGAGETRLFSLPSRVSRGVTMQSMAGDPLDAYSTSGGQIYTAAPQAAFVANEPTRIDSYATSDINRVLIHHALASAGLGGRDVLVGTGLPVSEYFRGNAVNGDYLREKMASIMAPIESLDQGIKLARVIRQAVYPQAIMAWCDYVMDDEGGLIDGRDGLRIGVVDVGGRTSDFAVVSQSSTGAVSIERQRSGSAEIGMLSVADALTPLLKDRYPKLKAGISEALLDEAIRTGKVRQYGGRTLDDVTEEVQAAAADVAARLHLEAQRYLGAASDLDLILYCGGGSAVLGTALAQYPHVEVAADPAFANARGMLKYMRFVDPTFSTPSVVEVAEAPVPSNVVPVRGAAA